jgi:hypothetical protein
VPLALLLLLEPDLRVPQAAVLSLPVLVLPAFVRRP